MFCSRIYRCSHSRIDIDAYSVSFFINGKINLNSYQKSCCIKKNGAGDGNRTHVIGLGSRRSAIELHPRETLNI